MFKKLSEQAKKAVQESLRTARTMGHASVRPEHLFLGLFEVPDANPAQTLARLGINAPEARAWVSATFPPNTLPVTGSSALSPEALDIFKQASKLDVVEIDDLARFLFDAGVSGIDALLGAFGVTADQLLLELGEAVPAGPPAPAAAEIEFCRDLVAAARNGELDPVIGRARELHRVTQVLARRTKNNPVLVGDPGVGKTAIVEGLAQQLAAGTVPAALRDRPLLAVDLSGMVAGARYRGDFEARVKKLVAEAQETRAILFIDEIHTVVGAGRAGDSALDASQMLKEALARGQVTILGATTVKEYRKHITADAALERRFTQVVVEEPTLAEVEEILTRLAPKYAEHHEVTYTPEALTAAAKLADRHIRDRFNPDKSIDVIDEAGARLAMDALAGTTDPAPRVVDVDLIATVVAQIAGVAVGTVTASEKSALLGLETTLGGRVVGQDAAVGAVSRAVRRRRSGMAATTRPSSFLFAGPTGVGKTELAKALADALFADAKTGRGALVRFDLSEFAEKHSVARLFGAPPGYVGYDEGGQLTEAVRRNPASVVLLDEVDKAHPDVFDTLLQVLDDGRMTDGQGRVVSFADTTVILTTNFGSREAARTGTGFTSGATDATAATHKVLKDSFRPEFLNRLDEVLVFNPLGGDLLDQIARTLVDEVIVRALELGVSLSVSDTAVAALVARGTSAEYGARPLRRTIERYLADPVTDAVLMETGTFLTADVDETGEVAVTATTIEPASIDA